MPGPTRRSPRTKALIDHQDAIDRIDELRHLLAEAERDRDEAWRAFLAAGGTPENAADARLATDDTTTT